MTKDITNTFHEKLYECDKHVDRIQTAKEYLKDLFPLKADVYKDLDPVQLSFIDQLVYRFSRLQDTIGESVFPSILILAEENVKKKTFIDILNRMEELELVEKKQWLRLREIRNEIAHEYSFNSEELIESLNSLSLVSNELIVIYLQLKKFCKIKFSI